MKNISFLTILLFNLNILFSSLLISQDKVENTNNNPANNKVNLPTGFPLAVIDMKRVLSISTAAKALQNSMEKKQSIYRDQLSKEEEQLKNEQETLKSQRSLLSSEQFAENEKVFRGKVDALQKKVADINRNLESILAKGMQEIQREAVKQITLISRERGYLMVFDINSVVIAVDQINISNLVGEKLNIALPQIKNNKKE